MKLKVFNLTSPLVEIVVPGIGTIAPRDAVASAGDTLAKLVQLAAPQACRQIQQKQLIVTLGFRLNEKPL